MLNVACMLISPIGDYGHDIFAMHPPHPFAHVPSDEVTNGTVSVGMSAFFFAEQLAAACSCKSVSWQRRAIASCIFKSNYCNAITFLLHVHAFLFVAVTMAK